MTIPRFFSTSLNSLVGLTRPFDEDDLIEEDAAPLPFCPVAPPPEAVDVLPVVTEEAVPAAATAETTVFFTTTFFTIEVVIEGPPFEEEEVEVEETETCEPPCEVTKSL